MKTHKFGNSLKIGDEGEKIVQEFLQNNPKVANIEDVSGVDEYRDRDIDLVVKFIDGKEATVEIKTDTYTSGNIFFETVSNLEYSVPGCMYKTQADYLFYYFTKTKELYILQMGKYREWFEANKSHFTEKKLKNINRKEDGTYTSIGYTIPKVYLETYFKNHKKVVIN